MNSQNFISGKKSTITNSTVWLFAPFDSYLLIITTKCDRNTALKCQYSQTCPFYKFCMGSRVVTDYTFSVRETALSQGSVQRSSLHSPLRSHEWDYIATPSTVINHHFLQIDLFILRQGGTST